MNFTNYGYASIIDFLRGWSNTNSMLVNDKEFLDHLRMIYSEPFLGCSVYFCDLKYVFFGNTIMETSPIPNPISVIYMVEFTDNTDPNDFKDGIMYYDEKLVYVKFINSSYREDMNDETFINKMCEMIDFVFTILSYDDGCNIINKEFCDLSSYELYLWFFPFYSICKWIYSIRGNELDSEIWIPVLKRRVLSPIIIDNKLYISACKFIDALFELIQKICESDKYSIESILREIYDFKLQDKYIQLIKNVNKD